MAESKLTKEHVLSIPKLTKTLSNKDIALKFNCHTQTILRWKRILRNKGYKIPNKAGRKSLL